MTHSLQRELDHAARWVRIYRDQGDTMRADQWQSRLDAMAVDGGGPDQSSWVQDQARLAQIAENPAKAYDKGGFLRTGLARIYNRTGSNERVIRRVPPPDEGDGLVPA